MRPKTWRTIQWTVFDWPFLSSVCYWLKFRTLIWIVSWEFETSLNCSNGIELLYIRIKTNSPSNQMRVFNEQYAIWNKSNEVYASAYFIRSTKKKIKRCDKWKWKFSCKFHSNDIQISNILSHAKISPEFCRLTERSGFLYTNM